jgi:chromosome segregation ATPase
MGMIAVKYMEDASKHEILEAISAFAEQVDVRFDSIERRLAGHDAKFTNLESRMGGLESRMGGLDSRLNRIEATMVTKSYLDDKLGDLKGDLISLLRKEDQKVNRLIGVLAEEHILAAPKVKGISSIEVFP